MWTQVYVCAFDKVSTYLISLTYRNLLKKNLSYSIRMCNEKIFDSLPLTFDNFWPRAFMSKVLKVSMLFLLFFRSVNFSLFYVVFCPFLRLHSENGFHNFIMIYNIVNRSMISNDLIRISFNLISQKCPWKQHRQPKNAWNGRKIYDSSAFFEYYTSLKVYLVQLIFTVTEFRRVTIFLAIFWLIRNVDCWSF